jgi:hypothetical protein
MGRGRASRLLRRQSRSGSSGEGCGVRFSMEWNGLGVTNYSGWMGLRSVPTTLVVGYAFAGMLVSFQISRDRECGCRPTEIYGPISCSSGDV